MVRVIAGLRAGEAQLSVLRISRALVARGIETQLLCGSADAEGIALARDHGFAPEVYGGQADEGFAEWLRPRLRDAEVVHGHGFGGWWPATEAMVAGAPLVASEHDALAWPPERALDAVREGLRRVDRFYAHKPGARAAVLAAGLQPERLHAGRSPVLGLSAHPRPWLPAPRLMFAGRLHPDKGPAVLFEALALLRKPPVCFVLGSGESELALRRRAARADLRGRVHFCGRRRDPAPWIAGASALIVPSRVPGGSQAAVLGMGLGVPVIGTAVDGLAPMLSEERGVIVAPDDPQALARAISRVLSGELVPDLAAARRFARQFGLAEVADMYETAYRELATPGVLGFKGPEPYYSRTPDDRPLHRAASSAQRPGPVRRS